jgi:Raf kinase inhibitor-like YbhB/YbcL family protein
MTSSDAMHSPAPFGPDPYAYLPKVPSFQLTSTSVTNGQPLPLEQFSKMFGVPGGQDISPQLAWSGFPAGTKSFVVSMYDPQAPTGSGFWHWVVADIPADTTSLPAGAGAPGATHLPGGAFQLAGDAGAHQYVGGAPPAGSGVHEYYLTVTALSVAKTGLGPDASAAYLGFTIAGQTLARATLVCPTPASAT